MNVGQLNFPTTEEYPVENIKKVQKRLLQMAKTTCSILEENGFHYFLTFGSLLGAIRHKGFIPWDDDFDLFLFEDEYEAAMECLRGHLPEDMILQDKKSDSAYYADWAKVRDLKSEIVSEFYPSDNGQMFRGIGVDLYKLKKIKREEIDVHWKREHIEFLVRKHDKGFTDNHEFAEKFDDWCREYVEASNARPLPTAEEDYVYAFVVFIKWMELDEVWPLKQYEFEDTKFWGPANFDAILTRTYGDYRKVPEFENRRPHCKSVKFFE